MNVNYWTNHFAANKQIRPEPPWQAPIQLEGAALSKLLKSLQQFQLGDGGGPAYLIAWNRQSLLASDPDMKRLVDLWFAEEAEHSRLLGGALRRFGVPEIQTHWSFELFCSLRRFLGVRFELSALLLTEIVSHVYYKLLRRYCPDPAVKAMCRLIIRDEAGHIHFHEDRLRSEAHIMKRRFGKLWEWMFRCRGLAAGTVLWMNHRAALRAFGATDREFYHLIWRDMGRFIKRVRHQIELPLTERPNSAKRVERTAMATSP